MGQLITHPGVVWGTQTNDAAPVGAVGEYLEVIVPLTSAVPLIDNTEATFGTLLLPQGDWDVVASLAFDPAPTTSITALRGGYTVNGASENETWDTKIFPGGVVPVSYGVRPRLHSGIDRVSVPHGSTYSIDGKCSCSFSVSTLSVYGTISARRAR